MENGKVLSKSGSALKYKADGISTMVCNEEHNKAVGLWW